MTISLFQFTSPKSKTQTFLDRYQYLLSIAATFLFFSDLPDYLHSNNLIPVPPLAWILMFAVLAMPFARKIVTMPKPLVIGMGVYLLVSILSLATVNADDVAVQEFRDRVLEVIFLCLMYIIYEQRSLKQVRYVFLVVVLISVANIFFELLNPGIFSEFNTGRPAGFYINPNRAGLALMLGMIFSINIIKKQYRWLYVLLVTFAVLMTFSKGSLLGGLICISILIGARVLSDKRRTVLLPTAILVLFLIVFNPLAIIADYFGGTDRSYSNILDRLEQFQNPSLEDDSSQARTQIAKDAWKMFGNKPFWGHGLGSTKTVTSNWHYQDMATHNMYLYYMADHGIIGFIFLPGAIFILTYRNRGEQKAILICFGVFLSIAGLFSHTLLDTRYILLIFAWLAALNTNEQWYLKYSHGNLQLALPPVREQLMLPPARNQRALPPAYREQTLPPRRNEG